ncbi:hypothetical protein HH308_20165 [Gordonia sp. TBRC 11910]|uniref:acetyl-CoA C-acetyltransferase n=1 Tax=Gordonia asplenii TaxID=2725283 RepID=A0A848L3A6_9ACTN|nr:hypothetical protein [Gordonia asplenii]NMO03535.1 hypothetical protein [Gordonia asplenii]
MSGGVVLVDAGRSAVVPDGAESTQAPSQILEGVIGALLDRSGIRLDDVDELFLADPRFLPTESAVAEEGWQFARPPFGLRTRVDATSAASLERAINAVRGDPDLVVVVAACDVGAAETGCADERWLGRAVRAAAAARWDVCADDMRGWIQSSYARSSECSRAGDFVREIVSTSPGYLADRFRSKGTVVALPACGASAVVLTSPRRAGELGVRYRAGLHTACCAPTTTGPGIEPLDPQAFDDLLAPCGVDAAHLDQLEVPEYDAVTPLAWIKATGISRYLVNPRGGDLGFGRLLRSGPLRSLVSMVNSLEATGGRAGALLATDACRTVAVVLTVGHHELV